MRMAAQPAESLALLVLWRLVLRSVSLALLLLGEFGRPGNLM